MACGPPRIPQLKESNSPATPIEDISEIISMLYAVGRDVHHGSFCPLILIVCGNGHFVP
jgi:hypothetical protein